MTTRILRKPEPPGEDLFARCLRLQSDLNAAGRAIVALKQMHLQMMTVITVAHGGHFQLTREDYAAAHNHALAMTEDEATGTFTYQTQRVTKEN